jgi:hypothetical protein
MGGYVGVARLLATAALWVRIQTSFKKIQNGRHKQQEWPTHASPPKKYTKSGRDLADWFERLTAIAKVATVLGSFLASSDKVDGI